MQNLIEKLGLGESATSMVLWGGLSVVLLVVVVALAVWLVRTLRPNLNMSGGHGRGGRPQRLAITDAFSLDRDGRKLVIVRRDNIEHLLLIGGPNDVLVESNIVRGERSTRDRTGRGSTEAELLQAAENALATELPRAEAAPSPASIPVAAPSAPIAAPSFRPTPAATPARPAPQANPAPRLDDEFERALAAMQTAQRQQSAQMPRPQPATAALMPMPMPPLMPQPGPRPLAPPQMPAPQAMPAPPTIPAQSMPAQSMPAQSMPIPPAPERVARQEPVSEMARRLNEVLQKPLSGTLRPPFNKPIPPVPSTPSMTPKPPPPVEPAPASPPPVIELPPLPSPPPPVPEPSPAAKPVEAAGGDSEMDLLEEEMARLLGRPAQPKKPGSP